MNILTIPLRNLRRKLPRTLLMVAVFSIGVASVTALLELSKAVGESLEEKLAAYGANILVSPKTETLSVSYGGLALGDVSVDIRSLKEGETLAAIRGIHHKDRLSAVAPKFTLLTKVGDTPVGVIGVDFDQEMRIKSYWHETAGTLTPGEGELVAGAQAAARLGLGPGDTVTIKGQPFTVAGVLGETGSGDDGVLFTDIHALQRAAGQPDRVHFVEVAALCSGCPIEDITAQIAASLPGTDVKAMGQVVKSRMMTVDFVKRLALAVSGVILLTACVMIGLSVFSSVNERKNEIGLLRALGYSKGAIFTLMSLEGVVLGLLAAVAGQAAGFAASFKLMALLDLGGAVPSFEAGQFAAVFAAVALLSALASLPPALSAARIEPSQALVML
ncbi:MAG: ABC transporter permease [Solidesulfovibrio sp.]|uniref:ABC transporter permease n=1 Tax=Solidesulfovibrio sp. TaxID=2910990 RepID=UPI002B1FA7D6|nr:ABC transporter permease [Solidesulfovibrio sp.]MEA4857997.1 ABC transporter permease [Solidesulfovibrio sp.]